MYGNWERYMKQPCKIVKTLAISISPKQSQDTLTHTLPKKIVYVINLGGLYIYWKPKNYGNIVILTPFLRFSPTTLNSNSSMLPVLLAIFAPDSPAPAARLIKLSVSTDFISNS